MITYLKSIFGRLSPLQTAATELAEAELSLLRSESSVEYSNALTTYNRQRVKRLRAFLAEQAKDEAIA
jgi:hypothetical protein